MNESIVMWLVLGAVIVGPYLIDGVVAIFRGQPEQVDPFQVTLDAPDIGGLGGKIHASFEDEAEMIAFVEKWPRVVRGVEQAQQRQGELP